MINKKGFTVVEILVVIVIIAVVGLIIMMSVIPQIEKNAKDSFITDGKLYLQAATKYFTDQVIEADEFKKGCISIEDLNKTDIGVIDKKNYSGYITVSLDDNKTAVYSIAITNNRFYTYNRLNSSYLIDSSKFIDDSILDNYDTVKDFPTNCPN